MQHRRRILAWLAASAVAGTSHAGFVGWQAIVRDAGQGRTVVDVFAGFTGSNYRLLAIDYADVSLTGTAGASFVQAPGLAASRWKPIDDASNSGAEDSFLTLGGFDGGDGTMYSAYGTVGAFATYTTPGATAISPSATWYHAAPDSTPDVLAIDVSGFNGWGGPKEGAAGGLSVWAGHFLVDRAITDTGWSLRFHARAVFNYGPGTGGAAIDQRIFHAPASGGVALLGFAGLARGRRRG